MKSCPAASSRLACMDAGVMGLTVGEAAAKAGLSVHTLRWYEQEGQVTPVGRVAVQAGGEVRVEGAPARGVLARGHPVPELAVPAERPPERLGVRGGGGRMRIDRAELLGEQRVGQRVYRVRRQRPDLRDRLGRL